MAGQSSVASSAEGTDSRERTVQTRPIEQPVSVAANRTQKIIRTVSMNIVANNFETVRETIDGLLRGVGGFVGSMQASDVSGGRSLRATLRVPAARLDETVRSLRSLGHVADESQSGEDVTEQARDIEAIEEQPQHRAAVGRCPAQPHRARGGHSGGRARDCPRARGDRAHGCATAEPGPAGRGPTVTVQVAERRQATLDLGPMPIRTDYETRSWTASKRRTKRR